MKRIIGSILCLLPLLLASQNTFKVNIYLKGLEENKLRVSFTKNGKTVLDTLSSSKPDFVLWEGSTVDPQLARIEVLDTNLYLRIGKAIALPPPLQFLLSNSEINIEGNAKEIWAASIKSQDEEVHLYEKFRLQDLPITKELWEIQKEQNRKALAKDTIGSTVLKEKYNATRKKNQLLRVQFIDGNPAAFGSILMLQSMFLQLNINDIDKKFKALDDKFKNTQTGKDLATKIQNNKNTAIGQPAVPFVQTSFDGKIMDISALKGKVILLDFWGSWCVPCRQSHPKLKEAYQKYQPMGLEIVGIANESISKGKSREQQESSWRKAISEDEITWPNILYDAALFDIIKTYDIIGYPTKYLIDQKGNIISKILGNSPNNHDLLLKKLDELFAQKN
jgi:thiol-disulfide isomerase/thioredoxin